MNQVQVESFDFTDANNWTPADDGLISGALLTLVDPVLDRPWTVHKWDAIPAFDGDGDCTLASGVFYLAIVDAGGVLLDLDDYCFVFQLKLSGALASNFLTANHYQSTVGNDYISARFYRPATANLRWYVKRTDDFVQTNCQVYSVTTYGDPLWANDTFRKVAVSFRGNRLRVFVNGIVVQETCGLDLNDTDGGSVGFSTAGGDLTWKVGGGSAGGSSTDHPYISEKRSGSAVLTAAGRWVLPLDFVSFDKLQWSYDDTNDSDHEQTGQVVVSVRIYDTPTSTWGSWVELGTDGDMSSVSANDADVLDLKVELDNEADINEPFTSCPAVKDLSVIYNATGHSFMRQRREPILRRRG